jgi:hypothetical protein
LSVRSFLVEHFRRVKTFFRNLRKIELTYITRMFTLWLLTFPINQRTLNAWFDRRQ